MTTTDATRFTRADYEQLPEGFRAFLIDGALVRDATPSWRHQTLVLAIATRLQSIAPRRVLVAPVDVAIDDWNVLQPDVLVARPDIGNTANGSPDEVPVLVVEVLSPATEERDRVQKAAAYVAAGVAEVWLVDPRRQSIEVVTRDARARFTGTEPARSTALPQLVLAWTDLAPELA